MEHPSDFHSLKTPTHKLYYDNMYMDTFTATVTRIQDTKVFLDQTAFFPRSGGQEGDVGLLGSMKVVDTCYSDGDIAHECQESPSFNVGDVVEGKIDWVKRYRTMQLHSAGHLAEFFLTKALGTLERTGSNVNDEAERSTYRAQITAEELVDVERAINEFLVENRAINCTYIDQATDERQWECGGIIIPCGGTHPRTTAEIGSVKLRRKSAGQGMVKIYTTLGG